MLKTFSWSPEAETAFTRLKQLFTSAPILLHPDPSRQFVVEVDASDTGVGAVHSQSNPKDGKLHPCAFFSQRLSLAECNYDVGNRELLGVKLALEEWHHWLEGTKQPFLVWTDHRNLAYIQTAHHLNSRQARRAPFLGLLNFSLAYRPGSKNGKPDALSHCLGKEEGEATPATIVPASCMVAAVSWRIEEEVQAAQRNQPVPRDCPPNCLCLPV